MADNYEAALALLNEFASMASVGAVAEQKNDRKQGRKGGRPVKQEKPRWVLAEEGGGEGWMLTGSSENAVVERGVKALNAIYRMTARIPHLMQQSHLESSEGAFPPLFTLPNLKVTNVRNSLVRLLGPRLPSTHNTMHQPLPRDPTPRLQLTPALTFVS
jgi:hypothetical protein